jgi:hypothetical protein
MSIDKIVNGLEKIGVLGSPSSTTELSLDILGSAVEKKLVGELAFFKYQQEGKDNFALGQITDVELRNAWLEDPTMRSLARHKGMVNPISGQQDTHLGKMTLSAVFEKVNNNFEPSLLGTVPQTGTPIQLAKDEIIEEILKNYQNELFYLGNVYGSSPKLPLWFKHFGRGSNGAGEAYHLGIFGKTGSGKSVLAKEIVLAYSRFKEMGIFILDPQGEFSDGLRSKSSNTSFDNILGKATLDFYNRKSFVIDLNLLTLNRWELFCQLLVEFRFFFELGIKNSDYQNVTADYVERFLRDSSKVTFANLNGNFDKDHTVLDRALDHIYNNIDRVYSKSGSGSQNVKEFIDEYRSSPSKPSNNLYKIWHQVATFFIPDENSKKRTPRQIVEGVLNLEKGERYIISIDLSIKPEGISPFVWDEKIKPLIIDCFLDELIRNAERFYRDGKSLNTLVVMDEAHRLAPRGSMENAKKEKIRSTLIDAIRTTRKFGLGWMFISQTLSSLDRAIIDQLRINFFGFGLSMGTEFMALKELAGGEQNALKLYQSFRDPHSAFDVASRQYSFMTVGPVSPLSFAGTPLFFTAYNNITEFLNANKLKEKAK